MNDFIVAVDSSCDLALQDCKDINVETIKIKYQIDDKVFEDSMEPEKQKKFYDMMRDGAVPKTSQINEMEFVEFWKPFVKQGKPVVQIVLASAISGTYNNAVNARETIKQEFPDAEIYVVDSTGASNMVGILVYKAAEFRNNGLTAAQTAKAVEDIKHNVHAVYTTNDLIYLYRGGRLSKGKFIIAKALGIKPLLKVNYEGKLYTDDSARGTKGILQKISDNVKDLVVDPENQNLFVAHADALDYAKEAVSVITASTRFKGVKYSQIGSTIGAHAGPGLISFYFIGVERK